MKKTVYILCAAAALLPGLWGCQRKAATEAVDAVELRYRADDVYSLDARGAKAFTILVASSKPWTVTSEHPDWCIISDEDGAAADPATLHVGKAEPTTIRVQYYDNIGLDDRTDKIYIQSDGWTGKTITVNQKGIAFLTVAEDQLDQRVEKAGGDITVHVDSNQDWKAQVTAGDWLSISSGATGTGVGDIVLNAGVNDQEMRYSEVTIRDRHDVPRYLAKITQDGVQLEPVELEVRAAWDQQEYRLEVKSNTAWTVLRKEGSESDAWYSIEQPDHSGDAVLRIAMEDNDTPRIRNSFLLLKTTGDGFSVVKEIWLRQAPQMVPERTVMTESSMAQWSVTQNDTYTAAPTFDGGMVLTAPTQVKQSLKTEGTLMFHWSHIGAGARVRMWYVVSGQEIKYNLFGGKTDVSTNSAGGGLSGTNITYDSASTAHDMGIKTAPIEGGYCKVTFLLDGEEFFSFDSGPTVMSGLKWGESVSVYLAVDTADSAVLEWYEYTGLFSWDE